MKRTILTLAMLAALGAFAIPAAAAPPVAGVSGGAVHLVRHRHGGGYYYRAPRVYSYGGYHVSPPRATYYHYQHLHRYGAPAYHYYRPYYRPPVYYGGSIGVHSPGFSLHLGY